ncbi:recombinase family protein [Corynebacterium sp.]|uniref:recombinase family protein n=1 Tax=Corynebacterium sp. TaxID=1720 RepID=UPI0025C3AC3F|nr:recombinase family protein [Corynebacterium sp.]
MNEAFIYCRISSDPTGERAGVERQEQDCRQYADTHGLTVKHVFIDNDMSAYSGDRGEYRNMWDRIRNGEAQHVIVWASDRLYRRSRDLETLVTTIEDTHTEIHTITSGRIDLTTPQGRMVARNLASVATYEVEHTAERVKASHRHLRAQGKWTGGIPPLGYMKGGDAGIQPDPDRAHLVQEAAQALLDGRALFSVAKRQTAAGHRTAKGNPITARALMRALRSPTTAGIVSHNGEEIGPAAWPALISERDYRTIQDIIRDPSRRTAQSNERQWQGSGIYKCGVCGHILYTNKVNNRRSYGCRNCLKIARDQERVDDRVSSVICAFLETQRLEPPKRDDNSKELLAERHSLTARLTSLTMLFTDGSIDELQLAAGTKKLKQRIIEIDRELATVRENDPISDILLAGGNLRKLWDSKPADVRSRIIDALMTVTILPVARRGPGFDPSKVHIEWK